MRGSTLKIRTTAILVLWIGLTVSPAYAQETMERGRLARVLKTAGEPPALQTDILSEILENTDEENLNEATVEYLADEWDYLLENPLDLNTAAVEDLRQLGFLSEWQAKAIVNYRESYGEILSWEELLKFVPSIDERTATLLQQCCTLWRAGVPVRVLKEGDGKGNGRRRGRLRATMLARYGRVLAPSEAYLKNKYAGHPDQYLLKATLNYNNKVTAAFSAQQDAGEAFTSRGFDAYAGYVTLKDMGFIKNLTAGHYRIQWGYGLNTYAEGGFFSGSDADMIHSTGAGIKGYASGAEAGFLQGVAGSFRPGRGWLTEAFYSNRLMDGKDLESIVENGYHRTENELAKKNRIRWQFSGLKTEKSFKNFRLGVIGSYWKFGGIYNPIPDKGAEDIGQKSGGALSLYYQYLYEKWHLFGEYAYAAPRGYALLQGVQWKPSESFSFSLLYRHFSRDYYTPYADIPNSRPVSAATALPAGKRKDRLDWQIKSPFAKNFLLDVKGFFESLRTGPDLPAYAYSLQGKLTYETRRFSPILTAGYQQGRTRSGLSLRFQMKWNTGSALGLFGESRIESYNLDKGLLLLQDIGYSPGTGVLAGRIQVRLRAALFESQGYENRLYAYEPDVLYAASAPAFYGKGCRLAVILKAEPVHGLHLELKYAHTLYDGVQTIGSGDARINGYLKPEIKLQLRYNLTFRKKFAG